MNIYCSCPKPTPRDTEGQCSACYKPVEPHPGDMSEWTEEELAGYEEQMSMRGKDRND